MDVRASLDPARCRPGCAWENGKSLARFAETIWDVILYPAKFYGRLRLRTDNEPAEELARGNLVAIGFSAAGWALTLSLVAHASPEGILILTLFAGFMTPLVGWLVWRAIGAAAVSWWLVHRALPDVRWAWKMQAYESSWLWAFCAYSGVLISSYVAFGNWMTHMQFRLIDNRYEFLGVPLELLALAGGNGLLCVAWWLRYRLILRAIRWSNF